MIDSVNARHVGNYTCKARNLWASSTYTAQLIVNGIEHTNYRFNEKNFNLFCFKIFILKI